MASKDKNKKAKKANANNIYKKQKPINPESRAAQAKISDKKKKGKDGKPAKPGLFTRFKNYLINVKAELQRVVWPTRAELLNASLIVVGALIFFGVFIAIIDNVIIIPLDAIANLAGSGS